MPARLGPTINLNSFIEKFCSKVAIKNTTATSYQHTTHTHTNKLFQHYEYNKFIEWNYGKKIVASVKIVLTLP